MTSSMLAGEKRWTSARRSGMTVLGKVAVPKPLNLPSQRLENHGLDPTVDIVPKGTISWGTQSSSVPNAWGSSSVSQNADGSTNSPSHLSGRPSSGGGTRPSTAGSDRTQDSASNAWGSTSRPSSASGALPSNQTPLALRPRSAETRPGSSQLSRFAEPPSDNSVTWGPSGASNKLGVTSFNKDEFSLSSGDFPTLGAEKDNSEYGYSSRPGSSSGRSASGKDKNITSSVGTARSEDASTWTRDGLQHAEHGIRPSGEKWQGDIPPCANPNHPPQQFDSWRGPPINHHPVWYRGPPGAAPYGAPLPPGGFPIEPFPFYRAQMPPNNSQPGPPMVGPRGHHPKNGELRRPHVVEAYMHPRMPINPGFYPSQVGYEGYYGPPMGFCNPNERDMPFMGMPAGPPLYKRYPCENAVEPHARSPVHGSRGKPSTPERLESSSRSDDAQGPYKVLLKQSNEWEEKVAEEEWKHEVSSSKHYMEKKDQLRTPSLKKEWGLEDNQETYAVDSVKSQGRRGKANAAVSSLGNKLENDISSFSQPSQVLSVPPKDPTLIQKIDVLNAKARILDGRADVATLPSREDMYNQPHPSVAGSSRRPGHGAQGSLDHRGKRSNTQDDEPRRKPLVAESSTQVSVTSSKTNTSVLVRDRHRILEEPGKSELHLRTNDVGDSSTPLFDTSDSLAQRALMREIAKQRAEQLQREEEERIREQKAKALAKLEELNRRAHIADVSNQKSIKAQPSDTSQQEEAESRKSIGSNTDSSKLEPSSSALVRNRKEQIKSSNSIMVGENTVVFEGFLLQKPENVHADSEVDNCEAASQVSEGSVSKHKRADYKQRQSTNSGKSIVEKSAPATQSEAKKLKFANDAPLPQNVAAEVGPNIEPSMRISSNVIVESSTLHKKKSNRSSKNKQKVDDMAPVAAVSSPNDAAKDLREIIGPNTNLPQSKGTAKHSNDSEQHSSVVGEEISGKGNHQWKPQQSRRVPRNQQANCRMGEKLHSGDAVTWAPVRPQNKIEVMDKPDGKVETVTVGTNSKTETVAQNNIKTKRAELERYVPKPVAKELAQQVSVQQKPVVPQNIESTQPIDSTSKNVVPTAELKNEDTKQHKPSKARGAWKQRGSVESAPNQGLEAGKIVQKPIEQEQSTKSDKSSLKEQTKSSTDATDGWNIHDEVDTSAPNAGAVTKGQGKRQPSRGRRSMGTNSDLGHENVNSGSTDEISSESYPAPETSQPDKINSSKENRPVSERTSQWQPKSQVYLVHNRKNQPSEGQSAAPAKIQKESGDNVSHPRVHQSLAEPINVETAQNVVQQDYKRERKAPSFRGRPHSPNVIASNSAEAESGHRKHDQQHFSSGSHKNENYQNNRAGRGHESRGDASYNRERPRQGSHFEYQPVGQYGNNKPNNLEGSTEGSHNTGPKYRERNQGQPRRGGGNFYGRQSGRTYGDARYD